MRRLTMNTSAYASRLLLFLSVVFPAAVFAQNPQDCSKVPDHNKLKAALTSAVKEGKGAIGGLGSQEWGTVGNRDGIVCGVLFPGPNRGAEGPGRRGISA